MTLTTEAQGAALGPTMPELSFLIQYPLDRLRSRIKRHRSLSDLLVRVGPTRLLPLDRVDRFKAELSAIDGSSPAPAPSTRG